MAGLITEGLGGADTGGGGGGGGGFVGSGLTVTFNHLDINTTSSPTVNGPGATPSYWSIVALDGGTPISIVSIQAIGSVIRLNISEATGGKNYKLSIPFIGIVDTSATVYQGPFSYTFVGVAQAPTVVQARSVDARTLDITFSEPVNVLDALISSNYIINPPPLNIYSVKQMTPTQYRLTTDRQVRGTTYTVTASNIRDMSGNGI